MKEKKKTERKVGAYRSDVTGAKGGKKKKERKPATSRVKDL